MRQRIGNVLWGIFFLAIGVGIVGNLFGIWEFQLFFRGWWTLFLIIPSLISIFSKGPSGVNVFLLLIGLMMIACERGYMEWQMFGKLILPLFFIAIGLGIVIRNLLHIGRRRIVIPSGMKKSETVVFSGKRYVMENEFYGMDADAVFGGVTLDLRHAVILQDISMDLAAIFGGVEVMLPENVRVEVNYTALFGGVSNARAKGPEEVPTVYINATAIFGGVEVK